MISKPRIAYALSFTLGLAIACGGDGTVNLGEGTELTVDFLGNTDVVGFRFLIDRVSCNPGDPIQPFSLEELVPLQDQLAPGAVVALGTTLDPMSGHIFADHFATLEEGCYDVTAEPVKEMDEMAGTFQPSDDCAPASADGIVVPEGQTAEPPPMISQCDGENNGGVDNPVVLNHPPEIEVDIPDKFGFQCEILEACATVRDVDNDPIEVEWTTTGPAAFFTDIDVGLTFLGEDGGTREYQQCARYAFDGPGDYEFLVTAYDLLGDGVTRIEDVLDPAQPSNDSLAFPLKATSGTPPFCVDDMGMMVPLGDEPMRAPGCTWQDEATYYCDAANAAADGFDLADTCPGGTFDPAGAFPACGGTCGDGVLDAGETCDDGNTNELDGCTTTCEAECGTGCALLIHFDGPNGSTTFSDAGPTGHAVARVGNAVTVTTSDSVFGGASGNFTPMVNNDRLNVPDHVDFSYTGDFTMDVWVSTSTDGTVLHQGSSAGGWVVSIGDAAGSLGITSGKVGAWWYDGSGQTIESTTTVADGTWHHVAFVRDSGTLRLFVDGTQEASASATVAMNQPFDVWIGEYPNTEYAPLDGQLDELRVLNGQAAWTSNFTPPSNAY